MVSNLSLTFSLSLAIILFCVPWLLQAQLQKKCFALVLRIEYGQSKCSISFSYMCARAHTHMHTHSHWWLRWLRTHLPMKATWVRSLGEKDALEKGISTHSSILAPNTWQAAVHGVTKNRIQLRNYAYCICIFSSQ